MNTTQQLSFGETFLMGFYLVDRNKTTFQYREDVPQFIPQMTPFFITLIMTENVLLLLKGKHHLIRVNDGLTSIGLGMTMEIMSLFTRGLEVVGYEWLYQYRLFDPDWRSPVTWWTAAIVVDFAHYWIHRLSHEINFIWASHQVHHSSEEFWLPSALRQSIFQKFFSLGFFHIGSILGVPVAAVLAHIEFNLLYQFWIHINICPNLGPLEWVFNTPNHHKVHHGSNKWCLDKNFGGTLIIWDRIFGTFQSAEDEPIVYGLVDPPQTFDIIYLQLFYFVDVFKKAFSQDNWTNLTKALLYGPGWHDGTPRLGNMDELPDKTPQRKKYNKSLNLFLYPYIIIHFPIVLYFHQVLAIHYDTMAWYTVLGFVFFIVFSLFNISAYFDKRWWAPIVETIRCCAFASILAKTDITGNHFMNFILLCYFSISVFFWGGQSASIINFRYSKKQT